jgi:hypothetical protein
MENEYKNYETKALIELDESLDYYIHELVLEICSRAGLLEEYKSSDGETFERVLDRAIEILKEDL